MDLKIFFFSIKTRGQTKRIKIIPENLKFIKVILIYFCTLFNPGICFINRIVTDLIISFRFYNYVCLMLVHEKPAKRRLTG